MLQSGLSYTVELQNSLIYKLISLSPTQDSIAYVEREVIALLEAGINLNDVTSIFGHKLAHLCATKGATNILTFLVDKSEQYHMPLELGCQHEDERFTPLHLACARGCIETAQYILSQKGIQVNEPDCFNMTPADLAWLQKERVRERLHEILKESGAQIRAESILPEKFDAISCLNLFGQTAFHFAYLSRVRKELKENLSTMLTYLNKGDPYLRTPLMYMAMKDRIDGTQFLCSLNAEVNARDYQKRSALFFAVVYAGKEVVETLLQAGADPDLADKYSITPRMVAEIYGREEIIFLFESYELQKETNKGFFASLSTFKENFLSYFSDENNRISHQVENDKQRSKKKNTN